MHGVESTEKQSVKYEWKEWWRTGGLETLRLRNMRVEEIENDIKRRAMDRRGERE